MCHVVNVGMKVTVTILPAVHLFISRINPCIFDVRYSKVDIVNLKDSPYH